MSSTTFLQVQGLRKSFGGVAALDNANIEVSSGEVHALIGENGAGKSTLIKILSGYYSPDAGQVIMDGAKIQPGSVAASEAAGIAVIHQESTAFPHLSAQDNIFVGSEPRKCLGLLIDRKQIYRRTSELLDSLGEHIDCNAPVGSLTVAQRQMVGIARALSKKSRVLILDEPTASLSSRETDVLFSIIRRMKAKGVSIIYVSHRLEEIFELADKVTVLRDGHVVGTYPIEEMTHDSLIRLMVGRKIDTAEAAPTNSAQDQNILLEVNNLTRFGVFENVSFNIKKGEIVGFAGLVGAGRSEVARAIFGADRADAGEVRVAGAPLKAGSISDSMDNGVALVPEDRQHEGLILPMSISANICMVVQNDLAHRGIISNIRENELVADTIRKLSVKASDASLPAESLSGGNQQKLVIGKWLASSPKVLILDEPTRGIDVGAKAEVHKLIRDLASDGMAVMMISSDLPEVLAVSDRIIVMRSGSIAGELSSSEATQEKVLALALSQKCI